MFKFKKSLIATLIISMIVFLNHNASLVDNLKVSILKLFEGGDDNAFHEFVLKNVISENDFSKLERIGNGIYTLKSEDGSEEYPSVTEEFKILDTKEEFLEDKSLYLISSIFSQNIKIDSVELDDFNLKFSAGKNDQKGPILPDDTIGTTPAAEESNDVVSPAPEEEKPDDAITPAPAAEESNDVVSPAPEEEKPDDTITPTPTPVPISQITDTVTFKPYPDSAFLAEVEKIIIETETVKRAPSEKSAKEENASSPAKAEPLEKAATQDTESSEEPDTKEIDDKKAEILPLPENTELLEESAVEKDDNSKKEKLTSPAETESSEEMATKETGIEKEEKTDSSVKVEPQVEPLTKEDDTEKKEKLTSSEDITSSEEVEIPPLPEKAEATEEPATEEATPAPLPQAPGLSAQPDPSPADENSKKERRPQFIIINNNEIIAGFIVDKSELMTFNALSVASISSITDQLIESQEIALSYSLPEISPTEQGLLTQPIENIADEQAAENDPIREDSADPEEMKEIENLKNSGEIEIDFHEPRKKIIRRFVNKHYEQEEYKQSFREIAEKVYYFDEKILGRSSGDTLLQGTESEFFIYEQHEEFVEEKGIYFVNTIFSQKINYNELNLESFILTDSEGKPLKPKLIFASDYEAIFIFETDHSLNGKLVKISKITSQENEKNALEGFHSLSKVDDAESYKQVKNDVKRKYSAYIDKDIVFKTSKISFGKFHSATESDSTIALEIGNTKKLDEKCTILVFGNDLKQKNGTDKMPISGLSLISKSAGDLPIDVTVVEKMEEEKAKKFLGFVYFKDLEIIRKSRILYLQLSAPKSLSVGAYQSTLSVELFCP